MAIIDMKIDDHTKEVLDMLYYTKLPEALKAIGMECEGYAKANCPVDTGRLRNSITHEVKLADRAVYVGTNVEYAERQEFGDYHHKVGKKHYLRDAAADHADHYKEILKAALDS